MKKAISGIMLGLLIASMLTLAFNVQPVKAEPRTWTVDDDGLADFASIQEAINAANDGDTVYAKAGIYYENLVVDRSVSLVGENPDTTTIDGSGGWTTIDVVASNVDIIGFTVQGVMGWTFGINLDYVTNCNVLRNNIAGPFDCALSVSESSNNRICGNTVTVYWIGISLGMSSSNLLENNNINAMDAYSINFAIMDASNNRIFHNNFVGSPIDQVLVYETGHNFWDNGYPSGGNYWSDYEERYPNANEIDGSGIWDTPYVIDENNQDNYPLMKPWIHACMIAEGWGVMWGKPQGYVRGPAELYMIGEAEIELAIIFKGEEYSKTWKIVEHYMKDAWEIFECYNPDYGVFKVEINRRTGYVRAYGTIARFTGNLV